MLQLNIKKNTKIVCTIGPASDTTEMIRKLVENGMACMRLNFSHGTYDEHLAKLEKARALEKEGVFIPVMLDTKGPEIRCHNMTNDAIQINKGSTVRISMKEVLGTPEKISVNFPNLYDDCKAGDHIKFDDGKLDLVVTGKDEKAHELICEAQDNHVLMSKKGVNCVGSRLSMPFISDKDKQDLIWGCEHSVDFISASFVRNADDVRDIRKILTEHNHPEIKIISKIENVEALGTGKHISRTGFKGYFVGNNSRINTNKSVKTCRFCQISDKIFICCHRWCCWCNSMYTYCCRKYHRHKE